MFIHPSFVTLLFALSALGTPLKRDAAQVEQALEDVDANTKALNGAVVGFPKSGGSIAEVWSIHQMAVDQVEAIQEATTIVTNSPAFSESDGNTIITLFTQLLSDFETFIDNLDNKKLAFSAVNSSSVVGSDLRTLHGDANKLNIALLAKMPADQTNALQTRVDEMDVKFAEAEKAYSLLS